MNYVKKNVVKIMMVLAFACPAVYADGDMGSGGKTCPEGQTCLTIDTQTGTTKSEGSTSSLDGDMGSGGLSAGESYMDWLIRSIYERLGW